MYYNEVCLISLHWQNGEDISAYISSEDATGDLMLIPSQMGRKVLLRVSRGIEEWNHTYTNLKASSLYRLMLQLEMVKSSPKVKTNNNPQASLFQGLMFPNLAFLPQNTPLLAFITVNGEDLADVQVRHCRRCRTICTCEWDLTTVIAIAGYRNVSEDDWTLDTVHTRRSYQCWTRSGEWVLITLSIFLHLAAGIYWDMIVKPGYSVSLPIDGTI